MGDIVFRANGILCALALSAVCALAVTEARAQINMTINASSNVKAISPLIYGSNDPLVTNRTFDRAGGNRWTAYNWETNASNAGADWYFNNDGHLGGGNLPGRALIDTSGPVTTGINGAGVQGRAFLVTIPMAGYVAADKNGGNAAGDVRLTPNHLETRFKDIVHVKGSPFTFSPNQTDDNVYTDEFVNWVENSGLARINPQQEIFYSLDNEPDLWSSTHNEVHATPVTYAELINKSIATSSAIKSVAPNTKVFGAVNYGWNGYTTLQNANDPTGTPKSPDNTIPGSQILNFQASFLKNIKTAEDAAGHKLVDVFDIHWYPEAYGGGVRITENNTSAATVAARVQAPRSLWDTTYGFHASNPAIGENSWIAQWSTQGPIRLLPREQALIDQYNPGTKLGITEYQFGAGSHISGGIAQADALAIFGEHNVYAAAWWGDGTSGTYINSAFNVFRNLDGQGKQYGDTSISATTNDNASTAVHASVDEDNPGRMVLMLINRTDSTKTVSNLSITNYDGSLTHADPYRFGYLDTNPASTATSTITPLADFDLASPNLLTSYVLPRYSVTAIELTDPLVWTSDFTDDGVIDATDIDALWDIVHGTAADPNNNDSADLNGDSLVNADDVDTLLSVKLGGILYGDSDLDGDVDGADLDAWRIRDSAGGGIGWATGDFDGDDDVDGGDFDLWRLRPAALGGGQSLVGVPEPASLVLVALALPMLATAIRNRRRNSAQRT